jgi:hypothetical protein
MTTTPIFDHSTRGAYRIVQSGPVGDQKLSAFVREVNGTSSHDSEAVDHYSGRFSASFGISAGYAKIFRVPGSELYVC